MSTPTITDVMKEWKISVTDVAKEASLSRFYTSEYLTNPGEWKGSSKAADSILNAVEVLIGKRKKEREANLQKLNSLLNHSLDNVA